MSPEQLFGVRKGASQFAGAGNLIFCQSVHVRVVGIFIPTPILSLPSSGTEVPLRGKASSQRFLPLQGEG
jgi:hypothetical protein